jgi:predicted permease
MFLRKLRHLLPWVRRADARDIDEELRALQAIAGPRALGNVTLAAEDARAAFGWLWIERLGQDLRYALRSMRHNRLFTLLVVLSLGLGIGANTAIFSFTEAILLRPLPVPEPDQLVVLKWRAQGYTLSRGFSWSTDGSYREAGVGVTASSFPYPALRVFEESDDVLSGAFAYYALPRLDVSTPSATDSAKGHYVSGSYFSVMRVAPAAGRLLQPADDVAGAAPVAVLGGEFSRRRFGAPDLAIGQIIRVNDTPVVVVGVSPEGFFGAEPGSTVDLYLPLRAIAETSGWSAATFANQHFYWVDMMARLRPGVDIATAQAALAPRFHRFAESTATTDEERADLPALRLETGATGLDGLRRRYSQSVLVLMGMVGLILLIACANVANLLLARATARRREIAVRLGMGAGRRRIIRQLLTESVLLSAMGGALGVALAWWGIGVLTALLAGGRDHFTLHAALNWRVLGVTGTLAVATGLAFGLAPALQATRIQIVPALKDARADESSAMPRARLGRLLVALQVALSLVLLVAAGLFGRTLANLHGIEVGFNRDNVLLFGVRPGAVGYAPEALGPLFEDLRERLGILPGVAGVSLSNQPLPMGGGTMAPAVVDGVPPPPLRDSGRRPTAVLTSVGPGFFRTMQIPIVSGRDLGSADHATAPLVLVVNRLFLETFGVTAAVGRGVTIDGRRYEIVGVVDDALAFTLKEERKPIVYFSYLQSARPPTSMTYELRTAGDPLALAGAIRETVRQVDDRLAIHDLRTQTTHIDQAIRQEITLARLGSLLAGLALAIACVGIYGTVAFAVARRTSEIGIRMALGAPAGRIIRMVLRDVLLLAIIGLAAGVGLSLIGSRYVSALLYGIESTDAATFAAATGVLLACGLVAAVVPALRAARIDPMLAVRRE